VASHNIIALDAEDTLAEIRAWLASGVEGTKHQGFPVVEEDGKLIGVVTLRDLLDVTVPLTKLVREVIHRAPIVTYEDNSLRDASDIMVIEGVGRLPVVSKENPEKVIAMITRSDLLSAHKKRLDESHTIARSIDLRIIRFGLKDGD
jgi:CIC family chloride channel protein